MRHLKEQACYVAFNPQKEEVAFFDKSGGGYPFQLPDGTTLSVRFSSLLQYLFLSVPLPHVYVSLSGLVLCLLYLSCPICLPFVPPPLLSL